MTRIEKRQIAQRNALVEAHLDLVLKIARKLKRSFPSWVELDDMVQVGNIALIKCTERFEAERGVPFAVFASPRVRGQILDSLTGKYYPHATEEPGTHEAVDEHPSVQGELLAKEANGEVREILRWASTQLPAIAWQAFVLHSEGHSLREIGEHWDRSPSWAHMQVHFAKHRLQEILSDVPAHLAA